MAEPQSQPQPPMEVTPEDLQGPGRPANVFGGILPSLIINGVLPYVIFQLASPHMATVPALALSAVPAIIYTLSEFVRKRHVDLVGAISLVTIALGMLSAVLTQDPRVYLIRESFLTAGWGLLCLISLLFPRPLMFYFGRYFATGNNPERLAFWNAAWQYPYFRFTNRLITVVWGLAFLGEAVVRTVLVYNLSTSQFLAISPIVLYGITIAVIAWTLFYSRHAARRGAEMRQRALEARELQATETSKKKVEVEVSEQHLT